ncbi:MAG: hypothetical protein GC182_03165 [Rhodopseudomonas sp.]|nr:hypothetical protein [Rhodopseudomonas sp.]
MTVVSDVKGRVATVGGIRTVDEAADLAALIGEGQLPQQSPAAFVLPLGFNGGEADVVTGLYRQAFNSVVAVVLVIQAPGDVKARKALATIDQLERDLCAVICGWAPAGAIGVFQATRGRLVSVANGLVIYQLEFALQDQLRITTP